MSLLLSVEISLKNKPDRINSLIKITPVQFIKEGKMYSTVFPEMHNFQVEQIGFTCDNIFNCWPNCYATLIKGPSEYLAMEDLRLEGYKMGDRVSGLTTAQINLVLLNLAQFHALSYCKFGGSWAKIISCYPWLQDEMFITKSMQDWTKDILSNEVEIVKNAGHLKEAELIDILLRDDTFWSHDLKELLGAGENPVQNTVINHGDCWTNNILFKYAEDAEIPIGIKFLDYQLPRATSRSIDLAYFLHISLPPEVLNEREDSFCDYYYNEFTSYLAKLSLSKDTKNDGDGLTHEDFMVEYRQCKVFGVVMGLAIGPVVSTQAGAPPDWEAMKKYNNSDVQDMTDCKDANEISIKKILNLAVNHLPRCYPLLNKR